MTETERQQERQERKALHLPPIKLHTREVEGNLGGHTWSKPFETYIGSVVPLVTTAERAQWQQEWWTIPYVVGVLTEALGETAIAALLAWLADGEGYHEVSRRFRRGYTWLEQQLKLAKRIVRTLAPQLYPEHTIA